MSSLTAIMDEMGDKIRAAVVAVTDVDVQVEPRMVLKASSPTIDIYPGDPSTEQEMAAFGELDGALLFNVRARVHTVDYEANQDLLLAFMDDVAPDDLSVSAALLDDPTLNGLVSSVHLSSKSGYVLFPAPDGSVSHIGCLWGFLVIPAYS